jgi:hypothetical protein
MARLFAWPVRRGEGVLARRDDRRCENRAWNWDESPSLDPKREIRYLFAMGSGSSSSEHGSTSTIKLAATSRSGPFATGTVTLTPAKALVRNGTDGPLVVLSAIASPLIDEQSGLPVGVGRLAAEAAPGVLPPGGCAEASISGTAPARPGSYRSHLDLLCESGGPISTSIQSTSRQVPFGALSACCSD